MSVAPARRVALAVLRRVREREAYGPETLDAALRTAGLSSGDAALATRLTYGTLETQGTLDEVIDRFAEHPAHIEPRVRDALRMSTYELLFMRTPARAAVHEGVEAVRAARPHASGFANAVLRRIAAESDSFPWGDPETDDDALARATGHPAWLVRRWVAELGRQRAMGVLQADLEPAPLFVWVNPFRGDPTEALDALTAEGTDPRQGPLPGCIVVGDAAAVVRGESLACGRVLVADAAAQLAPRVAALTAPRTVVDIASGRGTKTIQIQAACMAHGAAADIYALDVHSFKAEILERRMQELGVPGVRSLVGDATCLADVAGLPALGTVDVVLLDAPCSGLGALRRHPEKRWRVVPGDLERLAELQFALLTSASALVRDFGRVVYSTCSVSRVENQDVVRRFLQASSGAFGIADLTAAVPAAWSEFVTDEGFFQSLPAVGGADGHFVAVLERLR